MTKKGIIIVCSAVAVVAIGAVLSCLIDWPVDTSQSSGNIAKSSRFSRKTADEGGLSNMEELLQSDASFKDGMVTAYVVMQTRAQQFDALAGMSNDVAGDIPAFAGVLKDINKARPMISNVAAMLSTAGSDLNAALSGEQRADLAQNTINASLAYTTLQKQNSLADRFITTADTYLKDAEGSDDLKFVRDQWVDYQRMTAALDGDTAKAEELAQKGYQLTPQQGIAVLGECPVLNRVIFMTSELMSESFNVGSETEGLIPITLSDICSVVTEATQLTVRHSEGEVMSGEAQMRSYLLAMEQALDSYVKAASTQVLESTQVLSHGPGEVNSGIGVGISEPIIMSMQVFGNAPQVVTNFEQSIITVRNGMTGEMGMSAPVMCQRIGEVISMVAVGSVPQLARL